MTLHEEEGNCYNTSSGSIQISTELCWTYFNLKVTWPDDLGGLDGINLTNNIIRLTIKTRAYL